MEHLAPVHSRLTSVIVTTPQAVALMDAMKCLSFTRTVNLPVLGIIENMSGFVCPCCGDITNVFSTGGGEAMAAREGLTFLGRLPVDTELVTLLDSSDFVEPKENGHSLETAASFALLQKYNSTSSAKLFKSILECTLQKLTDEAESKNVSA